MESTGFRSSYSVVLDGPSYDRARSEGLLSEAENRGYNCYECTNVEGFRAGIDRVGERIGTFSPDETEILVSGDQDLINQYRRENPNVQVLSYEEFRQLVVAPQ
jgi:hypothetical protein